MAKSYQSDKWVGTTIIGYDETKKAFTHTSYGADGKIEVMEGTDQGNGTEVWSGKVDGKAQQRLTVKRVSPILYTFKFETAPEELTMRDPALTHAPVVYCRQVTPHHPAATS